jgi:hypothetical protein
VQSRVALEAKRLEEASEVTRQPIVDIEVDALALAHVGFKLLKVDFQGRSPAAQVFLAFREKILATAIDHVKLGTVAPAPDPRPTTVTTNANWRLPLVIADRFVCDRRMVAAVVSAFFNYRFPASKCGALFPQGYPREACVAQLFENIIARI